MSRAEELDFRERHGDWIEDWERFAGRGALADQVRFEREWNALRAYAAERGVRLIGDVPIYVAPGSRRPARASGALPATARSRACRPTRSPTRASCGATRSTTGRRCSGAATAGGSRGCGASFELFDLARIDHFRGFVAYWAVPAGARYALAGTLEARAGARGVRRRRGGARRRCR